MALLQAMQDASKRDREVYDREIEQLKAQLKDTNASLHRLRAQVLRTAGAVALLGILLGTFGPTVLRMLFP